MDGVAASKEMVERLEAANAKRKFIEKRRREIEFARASAPKRFTDGEGMIWTYVVMDESFVRIESCKREKADIAIPAVIDGLPVRALGSDLFHESDVVVSIVCPDGVESISACAFRLLENLKRIVFPQNIAMFSGSWLQHCSSIEEIVLPGLLDTITHAVFDNTSLRRLHLGAAVMGVKPGACEKTQLDEITIDEDNPFIITDGDALYTHDGTRLIALVRPVESYAVHPGCVSLSKKACMGIMSLKRVELPETLQSIGEFAFSHTGLESIEIPALVKEIQPKAFYRCENLAEVRLNDGLKSIGDSAFEDSGLLSLSIPASIEHIGSSITEGSKVVHSGENPTFAISPQSKSLFFDGQGGLYRREDDGIHLVQLIDREETDYRVFEGTVFIDEYAFAFHSKIENVVIPEGVREIRRCAFRVCDKLRSVVFPETLEVIGKEAFLDTSLESLYLPAGFRELSDDALVTAGAHRLGDPPALRSIVVHPDNPTFYVESGLLCRRGTNGDCGIVFSDDVAHVVIPQHVESIADHAFNNARNIETIHIGPNLKHIGTGGLSTWSQIGLIHIELEKPVEGRRVFEIRFPATRRSVHEISISLGGSAWVNVPDIMRHYDNCLAHVHDYNVREDVDGVSAYEQVKLMMGRFKDPVMLVPVNRSMFERIIREHIVDMCVDVARHDDRAVIDDLCDFGFINNDNLEEIIVAVGRLQDAAMTGYLLELKRRRFGRAAFDFDL